MAEKKTQENPLPEGSADSPEQLKDAAPRPVKVVTPNPVSSPRFIPSFTKTPPNELYRKLLPAMLFVLTFVTVMTVLLIYMDTVALGAQQFRLNMSRDYELARISAESPTFVEYVRQRQEHLASRPRRPSSPPPTTTPRVEVLDRILGKIDNGTLVEFLSSGARDPTALVLEARGWRGLAVRAAPRDFLSLRASKTLHACLSPGPHPREVSYAELDTDGSVFRSRVLCLPLLTVLLAAEATRADYTSLDGPAAPGALEALPFERLRLRVVDVRSADKDVLNRAWDVLRANNYSLAASFDDGMMFHLDKNE
ncbi:unnamed protein product [Danaus chrysippus]|uniref:(African queen) hypothetical protein n=1 Tax=Danaus chrysippus TaxID=151541 RepID=A0A8J2QUQ8_9NEOP|nr:unnamed protein product [Danaus chrysippus]